MTAPLDPYHAVVQAFVDSDIRYIVVGMSGINYYAKGSADSFGTMDYDMLIEPTIPNVEKAMHCLDRLGFTLGTADGPFEPAQLRNIVRERRTLIATTPEGATVELLLRISGYSFSELAGDAVTVTVQGIPVKVGRLQKLLTSKRLADRPKDRLFLRRYASLLQEQPKKPAERKRRRLAP